MLIYDTSNIVASNHNEQVKRQPRICVGAIANRGQWEQGCSLFMATDLGPVRATRKKKYFVVGNFNY